MYVIYNAFNIDKITKWFYLGEAYDYAALFAYLVLGLSLFIVFFLLFSFRWTIKPFAIILIVLSATSTYFISKYNVAIDTSMVMNVVHTDATEVKALLSFQMVPYVIFLIILPVIVVVKTRIIFSQPLSDLLSAAKLGALALAIGVSSLYLEANSILRAGNISQKYIIHSLVPVNYLRSIVSNISIQMKPVYASIKPVTDFTGSVAEKRDLVVVLAIGESSRQKNFSLYGYRRKLTNPVLSKYNDLHILNGIARLGSTLYALPEILEKDDVKLVRITSTFSIDTACYVNYTLYKNCSAVGEIAPTDCKHGNKCYDEDVVPLMADNLKSYTSGSRLIVLHLGGGSHGPLYKDRHPPEFLRFKPMCTDADVINKCTVEELYNSYDNAILYVDYVLGKIITALDRSGVPYVFIYLSDHGESLLEDGRIFHGTPPGISLPPEQAHIPLIIKSSVPISIAKRDEYTQQDVFDSILDLFSIKVDIFDNTGSFIKLEKGARRIDLSTSK
jgi:lipid A ethanolaminephosphotransferase